MKILLTVPSLDVSSFKGIARISLELIERLKNKVELEIFEVYKPTKNYFKNLTVTPLKQFLSRTQLVHGTCPEVCSFTPFFKKRTVVTWHDFFPLTEKIKFQEFAKLYTTFMWGLSAKHSSIVVANSSLTAQQLERVFKRRVLVVNPGVDSRFKPLRVKKEKVALGFFANFSRRKRVDVAVEVFKKLREKIDCKLILAGGELQTFYQFQFDVPKLIEGLPDVEVKGYVPDEKVPLLYNSFDFYLFPSEVEGFGIPILEAQACGIPVFIMENARIPEETSKFTIKCKNAEDMAKKILELLDNRKEYLKIRRKARKYARGFTWENFADRYLEIYESLI